MTDLSLDGHAASTSAQAIYARSRTMRATDVCRFHLRCRLVDNQIAVVIHRKAGLARLGQHRWMPVDLASVGAADGTPVGAPGPMPLANATSAVHVPSAPDVARITPI